jgi:hypothetical protein
MKQSAQEVAGVGVDDRLLPAGQKMGCSCFRPGPCCGKKQGQCVEPMADGSPLKTKIITDLAEGKPFSA